MKKIIYFISIVAISLVLFSCKSTKKSDDLELVEGENSGSVTIEETEEKEKSKKTEKEDKKSKKEEKDEKKDDDIEQKSYLGWIDATVKDPLYEDGLVKIKTSSDLGTFGLFAVNEEGKPYPVVSTLNEYSSTGFQLKAGKKVYKLISAKNIKSEISSIPTGINIVYDVKNVANVSVKMESVPSVAGNHADTVKFTVEVRNGTKRTETFALKAILDTVLGEKAPYHFYTSKDLPIKREYSTRRFQEDSWFVSKNSQASMQILLNGGDITTPALVALANYDTLSNAYWEPNMLSERAFDTVLSYNNSAVGIIWPEVRLAAEGSYKTVFYVSLGLYGATPTGHYLVNGIKPPVKPNTVRDSLPVSDSSASDIGGNDENYIPVVEQPVESYVPVENVYTEPEVPSVEFNIKKIPKDHLTHEYVQSLIERIDELEHLGTLNNPNDVNRVKNEILQLNAELDAILSILRQ